MRLSILPSQPQSVRVEGGFGQQVIICPQCQGQMTVNSSLAGSAVECPHCKRQCTIPGSAPAAVPPAFQPIVTSTTRTTSTRHYDRGRRQQNSTVTTILILGAVFGGMAIFAIVASNLNPGSSDNSSEVQEDSNSSGNQSEAKEARRILRMALDSWVFGDKRQDFLDKHPEMSSITLYRWISGAVLLRYEIKSQRRAGSHHDFAVTLVFQSRARTELFESKMFIVVKNDDGKWQIL